MQQIQEMHQKDVEVESTPSTVGGRSREVQKTLSDA